MIFYSEVGVSHSFTDIQTHLPRFLNYRSLKRGSLPQVNLIICLFYKRALSDNKIYITSYNRTETNTKSATTNNNNQLGKLIQLSHQPPDVEVLLKNFLLLLVFFAKRLISTSGRRLLCLSTGRPATTTLAGSQTPIVNCV